MSVLHSVYFYFKKDNPERVEEMRQAIMKDLGAIKTVQTLYAGAPLGMERDVVDNEYTMSLHAIFRDREALNSYLTDAIHLEFLKKFGSDWKKIRVFDTKLV